MSSSNHLNQVIRDVEKHQESIDKLTNSESDAKKKIIILKKKINLNKSSIKLEKLLSNIPYSAQGSVHYYNEFNKNEALYEPEQFLNIIRFLELVEKTEANYRKCFSWSLKSYEKKPFSERHNETFETLNKLGIYYKLLDVLVSEIMNDKVKYSKVYN